MTALVTVAPVSRVDALEHLADYIAIAAAISPTPGTRAAIVRQARCDLHALGVTTGELDAAGIR